MIKAVIFDLDDTLIDTRERIYKNYIAVSEILNVKVPEKEFFARQLGLPWKEMIGRIWPELDFETFLPAYESVMIPEKILSSPGALKCIKKLKLNNVFIGVITSRESDSVHRVLEHGGYCLDDFHFIQAADHHEHTKPDPRVFDKLLNYLKTHNINKKEVLYVGDSMFDYTAAKKAGIKFIGSLNGIISEKEFIEAGLDKKFIVKSLDELIDKIDLM